MFTLSGGHVFPLYDAAVKTDPPLRLVDVRHEQTAVFAAEARQLLHTTRRVAIPLLEYLDRRGLTRRLPDDRRTVTGTP